MCQPPVYLELCIADFASTPQCIRRCLSIRSTNLGNDFLDSKSIHAFLKYIISRGTTSRLPVLLKQADQKKQN